MQNTDVERSQAERFAASISPKLLSLTGFGFLATIYLTVGWPEVTAVVIATLSAIAAIIGYVADGMSVEPRTTVTSPSAEEQAPARPSSDARLLAWSRAMRIKPESGDREWTPKQRLIYLAVLVPVIAVNVALNGRGGAPWWYASGLVAVAIVIQLVSLVRDRRRRE
jgi:membrane protein YdbS with pleckstrin-like domain